MAGIRPDSPTSIINPECDPVPSSEELSTLCGETYHRVLGRAGRLSSLACLHLFAAGSGRYQSPRFYQCIIVYQSIQSLILKRVCAPYYQPDQLTQRLPLCDRLRMMQRRSAGTGHSLSLLLLFVWFGHSCRCLWYALRSLNSRPDRKYC